MDLYLDTNIIWMYFENLIKQKGTPRVFRYLYNENRTKQHRYFVSNLTKMEIFRRLHSGFDIPASDCRRLWKNFIKSINVREIRLEDIVKTVPTFFDDIVKQISQRPSKKAMIVNIIHCKIAREAGLDVLTGDEELKKRFQVFYPNILTYKELREKS